ncbi:Ig-like domain-containing protein [Paenibacillus silvisoli]|uniref:Ig-like domain-containing protein n=1 Tax=Paenibacillus silvisoli TaxID=3110539 RepID=UPI002805CD5F|nr:Ig-like domain-containing protein [Paenibacillus silvisoli]
MSAAASGPVISSLSPSLQATNVAVNAKLILAFDENVRKGTGSATIQIRRQLDNQLFESYVVETDGKVSVGTGTNRNIVTITPNSSFALNTSYYVTIDAGAFVNDNNNSFAGLTSATGWVFTTVPAIDTTAPALSANPNALSPANGSTGAGVGTSLTMVFNEPVYAASGNITISNISQPADAQSISVNSVGVTGSGSPSGTIVVTLPGALQGSSTYEVNVPSGAFQDAAGNNFAGIGSTVWRFSTSAPPLGAAVFEPSDNAFAVSVNSNFYLTFPGAVKANSGYIRINKISDNSTVQPISVNSPSVTVGPSGNSVIINPPSDLAPNTGFYILIDAGAFVDAVNSNKQYQGISDATTWNFFTDPGNDTTPPTLLDERKPLGTQSATTVNLEMNFSEPVYPGTGSITIRNATSGSVFTSIPVTSSKVSGGGTSKIVVSDSSKSYTNNQSYYVEIGGQAFSDAKGNNFAGLSGASAWRFTVTSDSTKPAIVTQTPSNAAVDIATLGADFEAIFNEPIMLATDNPAAIVVKRVSGGSNSAVATSFLIDPDNNRRLLISVKGELAAYANYYVEIAQGAITDLAGNAFDGILNQYQWTFRTALNSGGAPVVTKAELLSNTQIKLTFNKNLNEGVSSTPYPANFYVLAGGVVRIVTGIQIKGQTVTLTLQTSVSSGQAIKVSYTPGASPLKDLSGTLVADFSNLDVTNAPDAISPWLLTGSVSGNTIVLTFSEELAAIPSNAYLQFTLNVDGTTRTIAQLSGSGTTAYLTFSGSPVATGQMVRLSYTGSSYPLRDLANNTLTSFSSFSIQNGLDALAPVLQSVTAQGSLVTLTYSETLKQTQVPSASAYYVTVNGTIRQVSYVAVSGSQVILTLSSAVAQSDVVLVSYQSGSTGVADLSGNAAPTFSAMRANGSGSTTTLTLNGIVAKGKEVTITFAESLDTAYLPNTSQFGIKVNNVSRPVATATFKGTSLVLTLYTPVSIGDAVKASYSNTGVAIRSASGAQAASFTDSNVANQTTWDDASDSDYKSATGGGLEIKVAVATTSSVVSPAGAAVNQFALSSEKVTAAFSAIRKIAGTVPRVVFTVPDTEKAAVVALPLGAMEATKKATSNASIAIVYKSVTFEISLGALNYAQLGQMMNSASAVGQLIVSIDTSAGSLARTLNTQLSGARAQTLVNPVSIQLAVTSYGQTKAVESINSALTTKINVNATLIGKQTAAVWLDPESNSVSYVPTQVTNTSGQSVITFKSRSANGVYAVVQGSAAYTDLNKHWARNDVLLLANKFIVEGRTLSAFAPSGAITRGEFAMFIAKGLGLPGDRMAAGKFKDVNTATALAAYIGAASKAGIVTGLTDGSFKPNSPITREEMAAMMVRAASAAGVSIVPKQTTAELLKKFTDKGKIASWTQGNVAKGVEAGIIGGMTANTFGPKNKATRAEAAVMIKRLLGYVEYLDA